MNRVTNSGTDQPITTEERAASGLTNGDIPDRFRSWRFAVYAFAAVFVLSLALSGSADVASTALAYVGAGGMIASILGMGRVAMNYNGTTQPHS